MYGVGGRRLGCGNMSKGDEEGGEEGVPAFWRSLILLHNTGHLFLQPLLPWGEMVGWGGVWRGFSELPTPPG